MRQELSTAVGDGQPNRRPDVRVVQALLNQAVEQPVSKMLRIDGVYGPLTREAVHRFQANEVRLKSPDNVVDIDGPTLRALHSVKQVSQSRVAAPPAPPPTATKPATPPSPTLSKDAIAPQGEPHRTLKQAARTHASPVIDGWIARVLPSAKACKQRWRVPVAVTISQGGLESKWGRAPIAKNNFFGIKGKTALGATKCATHEEYKGHRILTWDDFRNYDSLESSVDDFGRFITENPRYAAAFTHLNDAESFFMTIAKAGYATAHDYQQLVLKVMRSHGIEDHDYDDH